MKELPNNQQVSEQSVQRAASYYFMKRVCEHLCVPIHKTFWKDTQHNGKDDFLQGVGL